ncbi:MAG: histidine phosphatase family protein [Mariprofundaceae bacterium]
MTTVDLLRHGELEGGIKYRGNIEEALTRAGRLQMDRAWRQLASAVDLIVTSPLSRCRQPAQAWSAEAGIPCVVEERFREMHYGEWEGLTRREIEARFPGQLAKWRDNPVGRQIPGAECIETFAKRVTEGWRDVLKVHAGKHVLLVAHSGSLRIILAEILNAPLSTIRQFAMPFSSWNRVIDEGGKPFLEFLNRLP